MSKWDEMAERERNGWLAEKVDGYQWRKTDEGAFLAPPQRYFEQYTMAVISDPRQTDPYSLVDEYCTDITAAMGLAEAMRARGWTYRLTGMRTPHKPYFVELVRANKRGELIDGFDQGGDTLPAAIGKCCYLALGGEE